MFVNKPGHRLKLLFWLLQDPSINICTLRYYSVQGKYFISLMPRLTLCLVHYNFIYPNYLNYIRNNNLTLYLHFCQPTGRQSILQIVLLYTLEAVLPTKVFGEPKSGL